MCVSSEDVSICLSYYFFLCCRPMLVCGPHMLGSIKEKVANLSPQDKVRIQGIYVHMEYVWHILKSL